MSFQPSPYSSPNRARPNEGSGTDWAAVAQAGGMLATSLVQTVGSVRAQKAQQEHEKKMAEQQAQLYSLQTTAANAQGAANKAAAAIQGLATTRTVAVVGGLVLSLGIVAAVVVAIRRGGEK